MSDGSAAPEKGACIPHAVLFGRPGAGKTTTAKAIQDMKAENGIKLVPFELDPYVPKEIIDVFMAGGYPSVEMRVAFVEKCTEIVKAIRETLAEATEGGSTLKVGLLVIQAFPHEDMRAVYRAAFPDAEWFLVDTADEVAGERVRAREGHFYKHDTLPVPFEEIDFPHTAYEGTTDPAENAKQILEKMFPSA